MHFSIGLHKSDKFSRFSHYSARKRKVKGAYKHLAIITTQDKKMVSKLSGFEYNQSDPGKNQPVEKRRGKRRRGGRDREDRGGWRRGTGRGTAFGRRNRFFSWLWIKKWWEGGKNYVPIEFNPGKTQVAIWLQKHNLSDLFDCWWNRLLVPVHCQPIVGVYGQH